MRRVALFILGISLVLAKFLAIGILSNASNFEHRQAIRNSWLKQAPKDDVKWAFIVGKASDESVDQRVQEEAKKYNDMLILGDLKESYRGIVAKTRAAFQWAFGGDEVNDFLLKCDDDSYVRIHALITQLKHIVTNDPQHGYLYMGDIRWDAPPVRDPNDPWYVSTESFPADKFPPYALGCGYVVGREAGTKIVQTKEIVDTEIPIEDVTVGMWMQKIDGQSDKKVLYQRDGRFKPSKIFGWSPNDLVWHKLDPKEMIEAWQKYR